MALADVILAQAVSSKVHAGSKRGQKPPPKTVLRVMRDLEYIQASLNTGARGTLDCLNSSPPNGS
jgi:hypothetical protein